MPETLAQFRDVLGAGIAAPLRPDWQAGTGEAFAPPSCRCAFLTAQAVDHPADGALGFLVYLVHC
jgi:hypothetical protein